MKRSAFRSKLPPRPARGKQYEGPPVTARTAAVSVRDLSSRMVVPLVKEAPIQSQAYMNVVRGFACIRCGKPGRSDFCHSDEGKGVAIKTDCRRGWPGCRTCHTVIGGSGYYSKAERRAFEKQASDRTRARVEAEGLWPARLPKWEEA